MQPLEQKFSVTGGIPAFALSVSLGTQCTCSNPSLYSYSTVALPTWNKKKLRLVRNMAAIYFKYKNTILTSILHLQF